MDVEEEKLMMDYRRIIRRAWATAIAVAVLGAAGNSAFAQSKGHVRQVGFFGNLFGCKSCQTIPSYESYPTVISPAPTSATPAQPSQPSQPSDPSAPAQLPPASQDSSMLDLAAAFDAAAASGFSAPNMLGDMSPFHGSFSGSAASFQVRQRAAQRYKVADNTSPIPRTRAFYVYNYFSNAFATDGDLHRNVLGAELAFLDNRASIEIRQSLNSIDNLGNGFDGTEAGNLVAAFKAVLFQTEDFLFSSGLSVGFPVGPTPDGFPGGNGIIAPFVGYLYQPTGADYFVQGFNQVDLPTDGDDQSIIHTDIGAGYWLRRNAYDSLITGIAPTVELHLYTPVGDAPSGSLAGLVYDDVLNLTSGVTFVIGDSATFAVAFGLPLSERDDYDFEAQAQFNIFWGGGARPYGLGGR
jgi:hypothetical protein